MATPTTQRGKVRFPTWQKMETLANNTTAACLNLDDDGIYNLINNPISNSIDYTGTIMLNLGGTTETNIDDTYISKIDIGDSVPNLGTIWAYSNDNNNISNLNTLSSIPKIAHVLYFEHAALKSFNFKIQHNHVIDRICKLYRDTEDGNNTISVITALENSENKLAIQDEDQVITENDDGNNTLKLIERSR